MNAHKPLYKLQAGDASPRGKISRWLASPPAGAGAAALSLWHMFARPVGGCDEGRGDRNACSQCLAMLASKIQTGELAGPNLEALREQLQPSLRTLSGGPNPTLVLEATLLAATMKDADGLKAARQYFTAKNQPEDIRVKALAAALTAGRCRRAHFSATCRHVGRRARIGISSRKRRRSSANSWAVA